ncbi:Rne/Rng family ribonuclease [Kineococcus xinjiangensis]|nr:Rne/Rng family ribonuclease [Kineococcus xinjiangensis]
MQQDPQSGTQGEDRTEALQGGAGDDAAPTRPRRRRAASRPAGPPVGETDGTGPTGADGTSSTAADPATVTAGERPESAPSPVAAAQQPESAAVPEAAASPEAAQAPDAGDASDAGEAPAPRRRSRRATKKTSAPAPAEEQPESAPAAVEEPAPAPAAAQPTAEAEPVAEAPASPEVGAPEQAAEEPQPAEKAPRTRTRARRATRKTAAPAPAEDAPAGDTGAAPDAGPEQSSAEAVTPAEVATPAEPEVASEPEAAAEVATPADAPAAVQPEAAVELVEELAALAASSRTSGQPPASGDAQEDSEPVEEEDPLAGLPPAARATALFFQAPEPERAPRRSRRASSPAGPPSVAVAEEPDEAEDEALDLDATELDEVDVDDSEDAPRRRRRRGGRGRRSRLRENDTDESGDDGGEEAVTDDALADDVRADEALADDESEEAPEEEARESGSRSSRRRRRGRGRDDSAGEAEETAEDTDDSGDDAEEESADDSSDAGAEGGSSRRRRRRRRRGGGDAGDEPSPDDPPNTVVRVREPRRAARTGEDEITALKGSTRLEAKKQRRREGREAGRRRTILTEAEFLARRESVERVMVVREREGRTQIGVLEDGLLVEHYVARQTQTSMVGNVYLGRVQNVLPSMEAAFVDVGKGRNAVLYAGEVNWDAAGLEGQPKRIEVALKSGDSVLVQVTKDPVGHKGARLTSQISLPGRYLVYVPRGSMTGISRKLPDTERARLKKVLKKVVPEGAGVIVRTAAEGISEEELAGDVERLQARWEQIQAKSSGSAPALLHGEPDLTVRVVRDVFNEDFSSLIVSGDQASQTVREYVQSVAPDLLPRVRVWEEEEDVFAAHRIDEQLAKALDRKVYLPSGGSLVIDRTEAMTVIDVNTGKFTGSGGNLEETVTRNNLEAAEEVVRQLRLRDVGGIIVIDFIDMVLETNRDLVLRRLTECLGRDRTKHQVAEVTSLGLVQMTRKRAGQGLLEAFSETCEACAGRGVVLHDEPVEKRSGSSTPPAAGAPAAGGTSGSTGRRGRGGSAGSAARTADAVPVAAGADTRPVPRPPVH